MFTKDKLEKWIDVLEKTIKILDTEEAYDTFDIWESDMKKIKDLQKTLEKIYILTTSDGSI